MTPYWSLRTRIVAVALVVTVVGVLLASAATVALLRDSLTERLDANLTVLAAGPARRQLAADAAASGSRGGPVARILASGAQPLGANQLRAVPPGSWTGIVRRGGAHTVLAATTFGAEPATDVVTAEELRPDIERALEDGSRTEPVTVRAADGDREFRVLVQDTRGNTAIIYALARDDDAAVLARLRRIELAVGAALLVLIGGVTWVAVGRVLRPLGRLRAAAAAIGRGGDLHQRMPAAGADEVGQLAHSIDGMLERLEAAFQERDATEAELRRFVADASHELRTPVTTIRGFAELLRTHASSFDEAERADAIARIDVEATRLADLIEHLLDLARLDEAEAVQATEVDLLDVVREAVESVRGMTDWRVELVQAAPAGPGATAWADAVRVRQVVDNLLANVRAHTPVGTTTRVVVGPGPRFEVRDNGPGLTQAERELALQRFWRADDARSSEHGSTGLGLAIVDEIVAAHGGRVWLGPGDGDGPAGLGLAVHVELPGDAQGTLR